MYVNYVRFINRKKTHMCEILQFCSGTPSRETLMVRSMNSMRHANIARTTRKIVMDRNLQRSPPPGNVSIMLNEEWLEDDR